MPNKDYQRGEVAALGREIYLKQIKHLMKTADKGKLVVIDVEAATMKWTWNILRRCIDCKGAIPTPLQLRKEWVIELPTAWGAL